MKPSSWDTNVRAEAEMEVVGCTVQERGDGGAWTQGEKKQSNKGPWTHCFCFFNRGLKANYQSYLTAQENNKGPPKTYTFPFFLFVKCSQRREKGITSYLRHLLYTKPLLKCWLDLHSAAREKCRVKAGAARLKQSWRQCNRVIGSGPFKRTHTLTFSNLLITGNV